MSKHKPDAKRVRGVGVGWIAHAVGAVPSCRCSDTGTPHGAEHFVMSRDEMSRPKSVREPRTRRPAERVNLPRIIRFDGMDDSGEYGNAKRYGRR